MFAPYFMVLFSFFSQLAVLNEMCGKKYLAENCWYIRTDQILSVQQTYGAWGLGPSLPKRTAYNLYLIECRGNEKVRSIASRMDKGVVQSPIYWV